MLLKSEIIKAMLAGEIYHSGAPTFTRDPHPNSKEYKEFMVWAEANIGPASIDVSLGTDFWIENPNAGQRVNDYAMDFRIVELHENAQKQYKYISTTEGITLGPGRFTLARTEHVIGLSSNIIAVVFTRSTAGRWGIDTRRSAGFIDPGYKSYITLEVHNDTQRMMPLSVGKKYAQIAFIRGEGEAPAYGGHYNKLENWNPSFMLPKAL